MLQLFILHGERKLTIKFVFLDTEKHDNILTKKEEEPVEARYEDISEASPELEDTIPYTDFSVAAHEVFDDFEPTLERVKDVPSANPAASEGE